MRFDRLTPAVLIWCCFNLACATRPPRVANLGTTCATAGARLREAWKDLNNAIQTPGECEQTNGRCDALRAQIERLSMDCPSNLDVVMANALLAFDARNFARAQQLLDEFFSIGGSSPEAAVLRIRIALEQGNVPFALRFAEQQVRQMGDDAALRETYASALYLARRWEEARAQLFAAQQLGGRIWRISYGRGLVAEAQGDFNEAKLRYQEALQARPEWKLAESRLRALIASESVTQTREQPRSPAANTIPEPTRQDPLVSGPPAPVKVASPEPVAATASAPEGQGDTGNSSASPIAISEPLNQESRSNRLESSKEEPLPSRESAGYAPTAEDHNKRGRELLNEGKYHEAIIELNEAVRERPDYARAFNARGLARLILKEYQLALADLDEAIRLNPKYLNAYQIRGNVRKATGDTAGSEADAAKAKELESALMGRSK